MLEQHNPDVQFDWTRILKQPPPQEQGRREDRRERRHDERQPPASSHQPPAGSYQPSASSSQPPASSHQLPAGGARSGDPFQPQDEDSAGLAEGPELAEREVVEPTEAGEPEPLAAGGWEQEAGSQPDPPVGDSWKAEGGSEPEPPAAGSWEREAGGDVVSVPDRYAKLGSEGLARLRARYAEVMARIADRPLEEDVREQLKLKAERLNPDAWVTADEVAAALEQYETVFEELRAVVGRQPRRHRRRRV